MKTLTPLAEQIRPVTLQEVVGQGFADESLAQRLLSAPHSLVLWGPTGCGKTTIARILAQQWDTHWEAVSAVTASTVDLKKKFESLRKERRFNPAVFFVDEVHHFNRSQQDIFLPYLEEGTVIIIGATTQNPSFALNAAFLSRVHIMMLHALDSEASRQLIERTRLKTNLPIALTKAAEEKLIAWADGDGRVIASAVERLIHAGLGDQSSIDEGDLSRILHPRCASYDLQGEDHYNFISALHKSIRASDVQAALYWVARLCILGEDRGYIFRRLARVASEDIGMAQPEALLQVMAAWQAFERLGLPEGDLALTQAVTYLATAPKSNALYTAQKKSLAKAELSTRSLPPLHAMNASTKLMKSMGYGQNYVYDHDDPDAFSGLNYFPQQVEREEFYQPVERGFEREIIKRLAYWQKLREQKKSNG